MQYKVFVNGKFLPFSEAQIPVQDTGFLYGWGLFETIRSYEGSIYKLSQHVRRLALSASFFKISLPYPEVKIINITKKMLSINNIKDAYIKIILSGGLYSGKLSQPSTKPNLIIIAKPFTPLPQIYYTAGVSATIVSIRRNCTSPHCQHKTLNFMENVLARREAEDRGSQEAIFLNNKGYLAEGCVSNLFLIKKGKIITPSIDSGILPGITRQTVIQLCSRLGIPFKERKVRLKELYEADEAFLTNSLREILPLTHIDSRVIGKGKPGKLTRLLIQEYKWEIKRTLL